MNVTVVKIIHGVWGTMLTKLFKMEIVGGIKNKLRCLLRLAYVQTWFRIAPGQYLLCTAIFLYINYAKRPKCVLNKTACSRHRVCPLITFESVQILRALETTIFEQIQNATACTEKLWYYLYTLYAFTTKSFYNTTALYFRHIYYITYIYFFNIINVLYV